MKRNIYGPAAFILVTLISGTALAENLPPPDAVPPGLEGPCREALEVRYRELQSEKVFLEPQIDFHEDMCRSVDTDDQAVMNECSLSAQQLEPGIDAYFRMLSPYLIEVGAIRTRLETIEPERRQLDGEAETKRRQLADLDARFAHHGEELNRALLRLTGGNDRIAEWKNMTIKAQKKALKDAFFVVADRALNNIKLTKKAASKPLQKQLDKVEALLQKHGAYSQLVKEQALMAEKLAPLTQEQAVLTGVKFLKEGYKISDMSNDGLEETTLAVIDLISMVSPPHVQAVIGGSKFGASFLYAIATIIVAEGSIDFESEHMAIHLRAISSNQKHRETIMAERHAVQQKIAALEQRRADVPSGCPELF